MNTLSFAEVVRLLKQLRESGVKTFEGFGLKIDLSAEDQPNQAPTVRPTKAAAKKAAQIEQESLVKENAASDAEDLADILVTNPAEYERLLREEELEDAPGAATQHRGPESSLQ